jgi:type IV pilus assembly protein PilB
MNSRTSSIPAQRQSAGRYTQERLGELLLDRGLLTRAQLDRALEESREQGTRLGFSVVSLGYVREAELLEVLSEQYQVSAVDLSEVELDEEVLDLVPSEFARKHLVLPIAQEGRILTVAMATPTDLGLVDDLKFITRFEIEPVIAGEYSLRVAIEEHYEGSDERLGALLEELEEEQIELVEEEEEDEDEAIADAELRAEVEDAPVVRLVNGILTDAVRRGASDVHIEPYETEVRVRYRIDGVLQEIMKPPKRMKSALISRIKILADLNIAERRVPQDGRIKLRIGGRIIDFRVSTLPVTSGEKIVLRILDKSNLRLDLEEFGMEPKAEQDFLKAIGQPYGMVLVTGPTGSGKTTTLYSAMDRLNTAEVNIMTAEDPVEYELGGINQVQVRPQVGLTFASALRAFLRQDPNIVMVGEIRDLETGSIAIKAALTGHLVMSTLHTNDAASTITRMMDMGMESFNIASAVNVITAQRLVRRICAQCKTQVEYLPEELEAAGVPQDRADEITFRAGEGCEACNGSGYSGRQGLYEVLPVTSRIRRLILAEEPASEIKEQAIENGMLTLRQDGLVKVERGITTLEEVVKETSA